MDIPEHEKCCLNCTYLVSDGTFCEQKRCCNYDAKFDGEENAFVPSPDFLKEIGTCEDCKYYQTFNCYDCSRGKSDLWEEKE